jgi:hypothetical protein
MQTEVERIVESLLYASGHRVWFVLETDALFGSTRKSKHDLCAARGESGLIGTWQFGNMVWSGGSNRKRIDMCAPDGAGVCRRMFSHVNDKRRDSSRPAG